MTLKAILSNSAAAGINNRPNRRQARLVRVTGNGTRDHGAVEKLACQR
jgi:hypothetical protein